MVSLLLMACFGHGPVIERPKLNRSNVIGPSIDIRYWVLRAYLHAEEGDWEQCNRYFRYAAENAGSDPWLQVAWGDSAWKLEQKKTAIKRWEKAIKLFGTHFPRKRRSLREQIRRAQQDQ